MKEEAIRGVTMDDVWGKCNDHLSKEPFKRITNGMLIARGLPYKDGSIEALEIQNNSEAQILPQRCPVNNDILPYKSVSVVCSKEQVGAVIYWLEYVHGGGCISEQKELPNGTVFLRSNYSAW